MTLNSSIQVYWVVLIIYYHAASKCSYYCSSCRSKQTYLFACLVNYAVVSFPDSALKEGKGLVTLERFIGSCKLSSFVFASANQISALVTFLWYYILFYHKETLYKASCLGLAVTDWNAALWSCILLRSNVQLVCEQLHNIAVNPWYAYKCY